MMKTPEMIRRFLLGRQNDPELGVRVSERGCDRLFSGQIAIDGCCCFATF
jgi:hypothetical protein